MQIFAVCATPHAAARALCDRHVINQIGETAELMCIAHLIAGEQIPPLHRLKPRVVKHRNHPCARWVAETAANYRWAQRHATALCVEYTLRYGKHHAYEDDVIRLYAPPFRLIGKDHLTPFPQVMPDYVQSMNAVDAYRRYYHLKAVTMRMRWTNRPPPDWFSAIPLRGSHAYS